MGCENSTAKSADDKKTAPRQHNSKAAAQKSSEKKPTSYKAAEKKPAEKSKGGVPADDATHITVNPTPVSTSPAAPAPLEPQPQEEEKVPGEKTAEDKKAADETSEVATAPEEVVMVDPAEEPAIPAVVTETPVAVDLPVNQEEHFVPLEAPAATAAAAAAAQLATAPEGDEDVSPNFDPHRRRSTAAPIHQASQTQRVADPNSPYAGPGPAATFPIDNIYRCFEEENGLLFRLVSKKRHMWAFYNDTTEYLMKVSVTFGPESSVTALDDTKTTAVNAETGECTLVLEVPPSETKRFMRGEYNGFTTSYDANPVGGFDDTLEAPLDEPVMQPLEFAKRDAASDCCGNVALEDASDNGTRIHFMEEDPSKEEPEDDLKKRHEEA